MDTVKFSRITVMTMVGCLALSTVAMGKLHRVGGNRGWTHNFNFTEWSANEHFYVGDWLLFNFNTRYYNILEVNQTSYEACNDRDFIQNITHGGRDVFHLTETRHYYFLSSGGYCYQGMKLDVLVEDQPTQPATAPAINGSPSRVATCSPIIVLVNQLLCVALALWGVNFNIFNQFFIISKFLARETSLPQLMLHG